MSLLALPPGLILIAAGIAIPFLGLRARQVLMLAAPAATLTLVALLPAGSGPGIPFLGYMLAPVHVDALSRLFGIAFGLMAFGGALYALREARVVETAAAFVYAGAALGVTFAGDLVTVFIFWEVMAIGSTVVVWCGGRDAAAPGFRYAVMHLLGGILLMAGIAGTVATTGSIAFAPMSLDNPAHWLILAGFLVNAGAPPFSAWLPDAYPAASMSGTVFLSAFTTKTAVYVLIRGFPGAEILVPIGLIMVFYGIVYGILETDIRRILCYSLINQVGFMVTAIGIGTPLALTGAAAHAFTHIIYKALLLMSAGSVIAATGHRQTTKLGGLFARMPVTAVCGIVGALSISAVPLTSGFVSKALIGEGAADAGQFATWLLITAGTVGVFLDVGLKWPYYIFFAKDSGVSAADPGWAMRAAMILFAAVCIGIGLWPASFYALLPTATDYAPYTPAHVLSQGFLLAFTAIAFVLVLPFLKKVTGVTLDTDWFWRKPGRDVAVAAGRSATAASLTLRRQFTRWERNAARSLRRRVADRRHLLHGLPTGTMALFAILLLGISLILHYLR